MHDIGLTWMILVNNNLKSGFQLVVHLFDKLRIAESGPIGGDNDHRTEETDFGVRQTEGIHAFGEIKHRVHEKTRVWTVVNRVTFQHLSVQTDHAGGLRIEHTRQSHKQHLEHSGFQQGNLIILGQKGESRNALREFDDTTDCWRESLREVLEELLLTSQGLGVRVQGASLKLNERSLVMRARSETACM